MRFPLTYLNKRKKPHEPTIWLYLIDEVKLKAWGLEKTVFDLSMKLRAQRYIATYPQRPRILWIIRFFPLWGRTSMKHLKRADSVADCLLRALSATNKLTYEYTKLLYEGGDA